MLPPMALTPCLPTELLTYVLQQARSTTLLVCGSRTAFLTSLLDGTSLPSPAGPDHGTDTEPKPPGSSPTDITTNSDHSDEDEDGDTEPRQPDHRHPLLTPTLQQTVQSRHTNIAFIPTVSHLRAYLSVFPPSPSPPSNHRQTRHRPDNQTPRLVVYGLLEQHKATSEWSTQGLGTTLAGLVEAGVRASSRVVLVEERLDVDVDEMLLDVGGGDWDDGEGEGEGQGQGMEAAAAARRRQTRHGIWSEKLPILNGGLRRAGADLEYAGRTVEVGMVLRRWFTFEQGPWYIVTVS